MKKLQPTPSPWFSRPFRSLLIAAALICCIHTSSYATTVAIGAGTSTQRYPLNYYFGYGRSAEIYTATEIGNTASNITISSIAFFCNTALNTGPTVIYLRATGTTTAESSVTWATKISGATTSYSGTPGIGTAGAYRTITLTTPFTLNSGQNLEVMVECNYTSSGTGASTGNACRYTTTTNAHQYWEQDASAPTAAGTVTSLRPNMQVVYTTACTPPTITTQPSGTAQSTCTTGTAYSPLTVATSASSPTYQWYSNTTTATTGGTLLASATSSSYTPLNSTANTLYYYCIVTAAACPATSTISGSYTTAAPISAIAATPSPTNGNTAVCYSGTGAVSSISWATVAGAATYDVYFGTANPPTTLVSAGQAGLSYSTGTLLATTTYYWKVVPKSAACGATTGTPTVWSFTTKGAPCYCTPSAGTSDGISGVVFNTINNTGTGLSSYTDYSATLSTTVNTGSAYNLSVYVNTGGSYTNNQKAWIDWNQDGSFNTTAGSAGGLGEEYTLGTATTVTNGISSLCPLSITVPTGASLGTTKMRVSSKYNGYTTSCATGVDGEFEDYALNVAVGCTAPTLTGQPDPAAYSHCTGSAYSSISVSTSATSPTYQWYSNTTAATTGGSLLAGATLSSYTPQSTAAAALYYYCIVTASACPVTSSLSGLYTTSAPLSAIAATPSPATAATGVCYAGSGAVSSISWAATAGANIYDVYFGTANPPTTLVSAGQSGLSYSTGALSVSTTYYWKVVPKSTACGTTTGTPTVWSFATKGSPCYCTPSAGTSDGISGVVFNTINNTGTGLSSYTDYSATQSTTVNAGAAYNLSVYVNTGGSYTNNQKAWIDWNQDGSFNTTAGSAGGLGEEYTLGTAATVTNGISSLCPLSITVPTGASPGTTRMRVSSKYNGYTTSCATLVDGEFEDYAIVVANGPILSATSLATFGTTCTGNTSGPNTFTLTGSSLSTANVTVGPLAGYSFSTTSGGTYTASLTLTPSAGALSQTIYVKFTPTSVASFSGNIPTAGGGASAISVPVTGASGWGATAGAGAPGCGTVALTGLPSTVTSTLFSEDFESYTNGTLPGGNWGVGYFNGLADNEAETYWAIGATGALSGSRSLTLYNGCAGTYYSYEKGNDACDFGGFLYYSDMDFLTYNTVKVNAVGYTNLKINFKWKSVGESGYDYGRVMWSTDAVTWTPVSATLYNGQSTMQTVSNLDLSAANGQQFYIGFEWINDEAGGSDPPFTVDDISITGDKAATYAWSDGVGAIYTASNTVQNPSVDKSGVYTLAVTAGGCTSSNSVTAAVQSGATNASLATSSVNGVTLTPSCTESGWTYYANPTTPDNWLFSVFKNGNTFTPTVSLTVNASPSETRNDGLKKASYTLDRYWNLTLSSGSISSSLPVSVRFFYDPADTVAMRAAAVSRATTYGLSNTKINGLEWFKTTAGNAFDPANNTYSDVPNKMLPTVAYGSLNSVSYVEYQGLTSFSGGTAGMRLSPSGASLPVTLLYLTATPVESSYLKLDWATASELNNKGFEIERSTDGVTYETIGWVDGHGNSNQQIDYTYNDKAVAPNSIYYYRLKQIDVDGKYDYSNIVSGTIIGKNGFVVESLRPNPANDKVTLQVVSVASQNATVSMTDMLGREIMSKSWQIAEGFNGTDIDLSTLAAGTYNVTVKSQNQYFMKKLVVSK